MHKARPGPSGLSTRCSILERHKTSKQKRIESRMEQHRPQRKGWRSARRMATGWLSTTLPRSAVALPKSGPRCSARTRERDREPENLFFGSGFVDEGAGERWSDEPGTIRALAERMSASSLGPDGLMCGFRATVSEKAASYLEALILQAADDAPFPSELLRTFEAPLTERRVYRGHRGGDHAGRTTCLSL